MTVHPIDTEALRVRAEHVYRHGGPANAVESLAANIPAILDRLAAAEHRATRAEAERDRWHSMWRQRGIKHLSAEHRATRAEAQSAIRGRAVVIYRERAREAEAEARAQRHRADDMEDNALRAQTNLRAAEERADKAEQRLAAWMDEYRRATHTGAVNEMMSILEHDDHTLRDGSPTTPCGQGPCCLGGGHEGNCRT